jgi:hypothetical protein
MQISSRIIWMLFLSLSQPNDGHLKKQLLVLPFKTLVTLLKNVLKEKFDAYWVA